jgi:uncharacterized protein
MKLIRFASAWLWLLVLAGLFNGCSTASQPPKPLKALLLTGGGYHDYKKLAPFLTNSFGQRVNITFDVDFTMDRLTSKDFAAGYDVVVYDLCFDDAEPAQLQNALDTIRAGTPAIMIHCAVHAFRKVKTMVHEWENGVGMRSKVHDKFEPFRVVKMDESSPILTGWPEDWRTGGDELYQTIEFLPNSHPLLSAKSPLDGRVHIVCWTQTYGKGRVFATTLGHDLTTGEDPAYLGLLARGLLWSCHKLDNAGNATGGYGKTR